MPVQFMPVAAEKPDGCKYNGT